MPDIAGSVEDFLNGHNRLWKEYLRWSHENFEDTSKDDVKGARSMEYKYIQNAIEMFPTNFYENNTFNDKSEYNGFTFLDKEPSMGDICVSAYYENGLMLCFSDCYTLHNRNVVNIVNHYLISNLQKKYLIPLKVTDDVLERFCSESFIKNTYYRVKPFFEKYYPNYVSSLKVLRCEHCGKIIENKFEFDGKYYCGDCSDLLFGYCDKCDTYFKKDSNNPNETLCPHCAERNFILPYHAYVPPLKFYGNNKDNSVPYLGIELEVDEGGESDNKATLVKKIIDTDNGKTKHFVYCMHDGSLNDGFEIITQPATLEYHIGIKELYEKAFKYLLSKGYYSHDTSTCGFHIHFNRDFYKDDEELYVTRLLYLVDKFWDDVVRFSRRNMRSIDRYSKKCDAEPKDFYSCSNKSNNHNYHYYAVNLANDNTIEFRMFRGTLNINTFIATLQFVNNCIIAAKIHTAEEIQSMTFDELITGRICKSYWKTRKDRTSTEE